MTHPAEPIRVALDAEHTRQARAGIARYGRSLAAALRKRGDVDVVELGGGPVAERGTLKKRATTLRQDFIWYPWLGRRRAGGAHASVYHIPLPRGPLTKGKPPLLLTVHDLVPLLFPETTTPWSRLYGRMTLRRILEAADRIITPSKSTADDLVSLLGVSAERIRVVHNGVDSLFFADASSTDDSGSPSKANVESPYILFVGTPEPRKNLNRLAAAVALARQRGMLERLVVVGDGGWGSENIRDGEALKIGRVTDAVLARLYRSASCVVLPSLHEGFGLPALEAMASGTPVVAARTGALPEITGGAAILVDPLSTDSIADGIMQCIGDAPALSAAGRVRAREFTWERAAAETLAVYRELG